MPVLKRHVAAFAERAEELERDWQDATTAADYFDLLQALAPLHRATRNLHATLQQARELVPADRDLINLRDQAGEIQRTIELLHGDARNGLDYTVAHQAEQQAERTYDMAVSAHRLNLLAAIFLPAATLSAIFGMNLTHGLDTGEFPPWALFWGILAIGLACGAYLAQVIARKPAPPTRPAAKAGAVAVPPSPRLGDFLVPKFLRSAPYFPVADVRASATHYERVYGFAIEYFVGEPPQFAICTRDGLAIMLRRVAAPN